MSRLSRHSRHTKILALSAALLLSAGAATGTAAASVGGGHGNSGHGNREAAALTGTAKLYRSAGDDITFSFDAHLAAKDNDDPLKATGTFRFSHYANGEGGWAKAKVDCLVTGGKVAVVSGVITDTDLEGVEGHRVGITVHDTGRIDRLGYSWAATEDMGPKDLPKCVGSAPFEKVRKGTGDFAVVPWQPTVF
ncbi:hypothetical protein [Streptomyces sporangiiformans]|uniref:Repetin n=1 Tax=Streptomyces sporangiiformans TaxID=2315329 RepID=A0A505DE00_9ACTN|nr:hypothetical protein [Streptomyces sporangiiformans]TPQ15999.1 hypothetical protein FGD71_043980 [Streptomyces sporangiiformans]